MLGRTGSVASSHIDLTFRTERAFGLIANLYSVRNRAGWGAGDLGDLSRLVDFAADAGAAFVGLNPLHALWNRGEHVSPYLPISRLYRNPLYLELEAVPELAECAPARALLDSPALGRERARLASGPHVDYTRVAEARRPLLEQLHREQDDLGETRSDVPADEIWDIGPDPEPSGETARVDLTQALNMTLLDAFERDDSLIALGEDVGL